MRFTFRCLFTAYIFALSNTALAQQTAAANDKSSAVNASGNARVTINHADPRLSKLVKDLLKAINTSEIKRHSTENQVSQARKENEELSKKNQLLRMQGVEIVVYESLKANPNSLANQAKFELSEGRTEAASRLLLQLSEELRNASLIQIKQAGELAKQAGALQFNANTNNAIAAYELAIKLLPNDLISLNTLAHLYMRVDNVEGAIRAANDFLSICLERQIKQPENKQHLRDLALGYDNIASILLEKDPEVALKNYEKSLEIRQKLVNQKQEIVYALRAISNDYGEHVEDIHIIDIRPVLPLQNAVNDIDQRYLSLSYDNVADLLVQNSNLGAALINYQKSLEIREKISKKNLKSKESQYDLVVSYYKLGLLHYKGRNKSSAMNLLDKALFVLGQLSEKNALASTQKQWPLIIQELLALVREEL